jgi:hypothetical protein
MPSLTSTRACGCNFASHDQAPPRLPSLLPCLGSCLQDGAGRLTVRAVARLLLDSATARPVLYVEEPYGGTDAESYLPVYDQVRC